MSGPVSGVVAENYEYIFLRKVKPWKLLKLQVCTASQIISLFVWLGVVQGGDNLDTNLNVSS